MPLLHSKPQTHYNTAFQYESMREIRGVILACSSQIERDSIAKAIRFLCNRHIWIALLTADSKVIKENASRVTYYFYLDERVPLTEVLAEAVSKSNLPAKNIVTIGDIKRLLVLGQQQGTQAAEIATGEELLSTLAKYLP